MPVRTEETRAETRAVPRLDEPRAMAFGCALCRIECAPQIEQMRDDLNHYDAIGLRAKVHGFQGSASNVEPQPVAGKPRHARVRLDPDPWPSSLGQARQYEAGRRADIEHASGAAQFAGEYRAVTPTAFTQKRALGEIIGVSRATSRKVVVSVHLCEMIR